jgi:hypothetical protein
MLATVAASVPGAAAKGARGPVTHPGSEPGPILIIGVRRCGRNFAWVAIATMTAALHRALDRWCALEIQK